MFCAYLLRSLLVGGGWIVVSVDGDLLYPLLGGGYFCD